MWNQIVSKSLLNLVPSSGKRFLFCWLNTSHLPHLIYCTELLQHVYRSVKLRPYSHEVDYKLDCDANLHFSTYVYFFKYFTGWRSHLIETQWSEIWSPNNKMLFAFERLYAICVFVVMRVLLYVERFVCPNSIKTDIVRAVNASSNIFEKPIMAWMSFYSKNKI